MGRLWLSPSVDSAPVLTLLGSTNLHSRSADIDTELSFVMVLPPREPCHYLGAVAGGIGGSGTGRGVAMDTEPVADIDVSGSNQGREVGDLDPISNLRLQLAREVADIRADAKEWRGDTRKSSPFKVEGAASCPPTGWCPSAPTAILLVFDPNASLAKA
ncbi:hypothetical protein D9757_010389 [Collybiopsis confluens]|uniref:Uncharacterized protein n=1 Tax=Collybiopsis confluens TaxID=2823264 RepID=A0A8H5LVH5_9AGAR|nr:hypothetical protein D9757_010389 [Collybiopsis confluens]